MAVVDYFAPKLTYQLAHGTVSGHIASNAINFTVRPAQPQSSPPPGNYVIHPPMKDPIYGLVALMTPADSSGSGSSVPAEYKLSSPFYKSNSPAFMKANAPAVKHLEPATAKHALSGQSNLGSSVFVLSSRPISGQNSLVVTSGLADLMDALQAAGGTTVTVG